MLSVYMVFNEYDSFFDVLLVKRSKESLLAGVNLSSCEISR